MSWYKIAQSNYIAYHGSPKDFQEFSYEFLGANGTAEGYGFYFTSDKNIAEGYAEGEKLKKAVLDIKKPLSPKTITISEQNLSYFLKTLDPTGDDYLSNWGEARYSGYEQVLRTAVKEELSGSDNDVDLISGIINASGGNAEAINKMLKQTLGYDGIIVEKSSWGGNQIIYIVFDNNQIRYI